MPDTLIVIDAQDRYVSSVYPEYAPCIEGTKRQIELAKRRGDHILMVEFDENARAMYSNSSSEKWPSVKKLNDSLKNYHNKTYVFKGAQDGGDEIIRTLSDKNIFKNNLRVCGVYAAYCVKDTVLTLARNLPGTKIRLVRDAIACFKGDEQMKAYAFQDLCFYDNVSVM